jgi:transposase
MAETTPLAKRQEVIRLKDLGKKRLEISRELSLSYSIVWELCERYSKEGLSGLQTKYENCGKPSPSRTNKIYRAAIWLKRLHTEWGADYIRCRLKERYPNDGLPTARTFQNWFKSAGLSTKLKSKMPVIESKRAKEVHQVWQVDSKEQLELSNKESACYLTIVDEHSGSLLTAECFLKGTHRTS